jgi:hypothetical protein
MLWGKANGSKKKKKKARINLRKKLVEKNKPSCIQGEEN